MPSISDHSPWRSAGSVTHIMMEAHDSFPWRHCPAVPPPKKLGAGTGLRTGREESRSLLYEET